MNKTNKMHKGWDDAKVEMEIDSAPIHSAVWNALRTIGGESVYGEDAILDRLVVLLRGYYLVRAHGLTIYRGGHHVAVCAGMECLSLITF